MDFTRAYKLKNKEPIDGEKMLGTPLLEKARKIRKGSYEVRNRNVEFESDR